MTDVSLVFGELYWAFTDAFSSFMKVPKDGHPKDVMFMTYPPDRGFFKWSASVDGREVLICELCYCYPPFENIRGWMERSLVFDHFGHFNTHMLTLESRDYTVTVSLHHLGWDKVTRRPISYMVIVRSDQAEPVLCCLCKTNGTIKRMYESLMEGPDLHFSVSPRCPESAGIPELHFLGHFQGAGSAGDRELHFPSGQYQ